MVKALVVAVVAAIESIPIVMRSTSIECPVLHWITAITLSLFAIAQCRAEDQETNPFAIFPSAMVTNGASFVSIDIHIPPNHHIYADRLAFELDGAATTPTLPKPKLVADKFSGGDRQVFEGDIRALLSWPTNSNGSTLSIDFQGCSDSECYFPERREWKLGTDRSFIAINDSGKSSSADTVAGSWTNGFRVVARASGYLSREKFLAFLNEVHSGPDPSREERSVPTGFGTIATLALILVGGLALNLTPCVLPMIPINLAILGAGAHGGNRRRGFALGSSYGAGMALAYGALGLGVVLTGSRFGALNSSAWFNFVIALIFVVLGLAMFDKMAIDFSRFQPAGGSRNSGRGAFLTAGVMGLISALLAEDFRLSLGFAGRANQDR